MVVGKERGDWICLCFGWPVRAEAARGTEREYQKNGINYNNGKYQLNKSLNGYLCYL